jgi:bifunctional aspartokinase / homoserine dehydrogenase 1
MSFSIVRVEGDIVKDLISLVNLEKYLEGQQSVRILVNSSHSKIYKLVGESIDKVLYAGSGAEYIAVELSSIWRIHTGSEPGNDFSNETARLANLLRGIFLTGDYSAGLQDAVRSQAEVLSALLLAEKFIQSGKAARLLHPADLDLKATADYGNATLTGLSLEKLNGLDHETVWIIPGSFGVTSAGKIARTGKNAADYTAAFLVGETHAERLVLWGTASQFYAADHSIVPEAGIIERLTYAEASELAYFDHFSLHPRTVEPLIKKHIPIHLIDPQSEFYEPVTIINTENFVAPNVVKSVACTDDISVLQLNGPGVGLKPGILARITGKLAEASVNIKSVITSQVSINILLDSSSGKQAVRVAGELGFTAVSDIALLEEVSLIAIVGHGMQSNYGISSKLFGAVAKNRINVILSGSGASDLVSYLLVHSSDRDKSVRAVYQAFFEIT